MSCDLFVNDLKLPPWIVGGRWRWEQTVDLRGIRCTLKLYQLFSNMNIKLQGGDLNLDTESRLIYNETPPLLAGNKNAVLHCLFTPTKSNNFHYQGVCCI